MHEINWWKTPPESPDLNPIENLWHELKEFIRWEVKPQTKDELILGIEGFWGSVSGEKCRKYIRHLQKVIPRVVEMLLDNNYFTLYCTYIIQCTFYYITGMLQFIKYNKQFWHVGHTYYILCMYCMSGTAISVVAVIGLVIFCMHSLPKITMGDVQWVISRCSAWGFDSWGLTPKILSRLASLF